MVGFVNMLELNDQKYQTNLTVKCESYKRNFLFLMNDFVSFGTDHQSIFFMSNRFVKDKNNGVCVPEFQLAHIRDTKIH